MKLSRKIALLGAMAFAIAVPGATDAQNYRLPGQHNEQHGELIASQASTVEVGNTTKYLESLFAEEEEPEFDIYTEGWESNYVNTD